MARKQNQKNDGEAFNPLKESLGKERAIYNRYAGGFVKIA